MAFQETDIDDSAFFDVVEDFNDVRQSFQREAILPRKPGKLALRNPPMEQLGRTIPAFGGLFLGGFFSEVEKKIVVDLGNGDGPVERAFHSFRRLKEGE